MAKNNKKGNEKDNEGIFTPIDAEEAAENAKAENDIEEFEAGGDMSTLVTEDYDASQIQVLEGLEPRGWSPVSTPSSSIASERIFSYVS